MSFLNKDAPAEWAEKRKNMDVKTECKDQLCPCVAHNDDVERNLTDDEIKTLDVWSHNNAPLVIRALFYRLLREVVRNRKGC